MTFDFGIHEVQWHTCRIMSRPLEALLHSAGKNCPNETGSLTRPADDEGSVKSSHAWQLALRQAAHAQSKMQLCT